MTVIIVQNLHKTSIFNRCKIIQNEYIKGALLINCSKI